MNSKDWEILAEFGVTPDNLKVGGGLYLKGTAIKTLPDNLKVGGDLYLKGTAIKTLPDNLKVGGNLYLEGTAIKTLPDNLKVGGGLYLEGTAIKGVVYNCGPNKRYIYIHPTTKKIRIGCFEGDFQEAKEAILKKYGGQVAEEYISKVVQLVKINNISL